MDSNYIKISRDRKESKDMNINNDSKVTRSVLILRMAETEYIENNIKNTNRDRKDIQTINLIFNGHAQHINSCMHLFRPLILSPELVIF